MLRHLQASAIALATLVSACGSQMTPPNARVVTVQSAEATFDAEAGRYDLAWTLDREGAAVDLYVADSPDAARGV
ncbi:MAG: hypothetical protein AAFY10_14875, partial [Pseudomonadota bacterium]